MSVRPVVDSRTRVLLLEDDPDIRELYSELLRTAGFNVEEAGTVSFALQLCKKQKFDVAILDHELPDGDGFEVARRCGEDFPAVAFSSHTDAQARRAAESAGCKTYLVKSCSAKELVESVRALAEAA